MQGRNPGILHRVKNSGIGVFLNLADAGNQIGIATGHSQPPTAHIKRLGKRIQFNAYIFRAGRHQKTDMFLSGKDDLAVWIIVTNGNVILTGKGHQLIQKFQCGAGAGRIVRVIQKHGGGFVRHVRGNVFQCRQIIILRKDGNIIRNALTHQDAGSIRRIAGIGH